MSETNGKSAPEINDSLDDIRDDLRERANKARLDVVKQLYNMAETIRKEVNESEDIDEEAKQQADKFVTGLEKAATYLNQNTVDELGEDATDVVRRNPWKTMGIVFVVGLVIGLLLRR